MSINLCFLNFDFGGTASATLAAVPICRESVSPRIRQLVLLFNGGTSLRVLFEVNIWQG